MSDFLDRLASRAIGTETTLVPRLPSLFEPLQVAPILSLIDEGEAPSRDRDAVSATTAVLPEVQLQPMREASPAERSRAPAMPAGPPLVSEPDHTSVPSQRHTRASPMLKVAPRSDPPVERPVTSSTPAHPEATSRPSAMPPRQTRITHADEAPPPQPVTASLRPAPGPVFGTPRSNVAPTPAGQGTARHAPAAPVGRGTGASSEPVVHVSIGRLEVRAAAVAAAAPRRQDGPRPANLDDYLRQRGDKGSS